jgi:hypothetical protein
MSATIKKVFAETKDAKALIPTGVKLLPLDEAFRNNPYPILELLRETEPVHRDNALEPRPRPVRHPAKEHSPSVLRGR